VLAEKIASVFHATALSNYLNQTGRAYTILCLSSKKIIGRARRILLPAVARSFIKGC
jgi:hypothetical protein